MRSQRVLIELARDYTSLNQGPNQLHQPVYRYRSPNVAWLRDILVDHQLHVSSPADQNDIDEFAPSLPRFESESDVRSLARAIFLGAMQLYESAGRPSLLDISSVVNWHPQTSASMSVGMPAERLLEEFMVEMFHQGRLAYIFEQHLLRTRRASRICCFSEDPFSSLMWARYADSFRGVAIEFSFPRHVLYKVEYATDRPAWPSNPTELDRMFLTKHHSWSHEREWRICLYGCDRPAVDLDPAWITGIVFGPRCPLPVVRAVLKMRQKGGLRHSRCLRLDSNHRRFGFRLVEFPPTNDNFLLEHFRQGGAENEMPFTYDHQTGRV